LDGEAVGDKERCDGDFGQSGCGAAHEQPVGGGHDDGG
jgi:hypothetical protein